MKINKIASARLVNETIQGKFGPFQAYVVKGDAFSDTFSIKSQLKNLGFTWSGTRNAWWISAKSMSPYIQTQLQGLNVITDATVQNETGQATQAAQATQTTTAQPAQQPQSPQQPQQPSTKQWTTDPGTEALEKWYKFPINKNIESYTLDFEINGEKHSEPVTISRTCVFAGDVYKKTKSREHVGLPRYVVRIGTKTQPEEHDYSSDENAKFEKATKAGAIGTMSFTSKEKWGTFNEEEYLKKIKDVIKIKVENNPPQKITSNAHSALSVYYDEQKQTPELIEFLKELDSYDNGVRGKDLGITTTINNSTYPEYNGSYKTKISSLGEIYIDTNLDLKEAPYPTTVAHTSIFGIHTVELLKSRLFEIANTDKAQQAYLKYLQSFPFLKAEKDRAVQDAATIVNEINSENTELILKKIQQIGYIRPHKRQKQNVGLSSGEEIKWIIDSKKIVDDTYSNRSLHNEPKFFYTVIAYYIHRKVRKIWSWTDMMLTDAIRTWIGTMEGFDVPFDKKTIYNTIESIGNKIVTQIYGEEKARDPKDDFKNFYNEDNGQQWQNGQGGQNGNRPKNPLNQSAISEFANFAEKYGIETENIENNLKSIYRTLAQAIHPDKFQDPTEKANKTKEFQELQSIWEKIKENYTVASTWYDEFIIKTS